MKLILAIVGREDSHAVMDSLTKNNFRVTKLATTGGFLKSGNTTIITGVEDELVDEAIEIISEHSSKREQLVPKNNSSISDYEFSILPFSVTVGGATIFVLDVDRFEKI